MLISLTNIIWVYIKQFVLFFFFLKKQSFMNGQAHIHSDALLFWKKHTWKIILTFHKIWTVSTRVQPDFPTWNSLFQRPLQREDSQEQDQWLHFWSPNQVEMADEETPMAFPLIGGLIFSCIICQSLYTILVTSELLSVIHNDLKKQHCIFSICSELSQHSLILSAAQ